MKSVPVSTDLFLNDHYRFRRNVLNGKVEFKTLPKGGICLIKNDENFKIMEIKKKITMEDVPGKYGLCTRNDYAVCNHCLRHIAYNDVVTDELWVISHVNPLRIVPNAQCPYFRSDELAIYAKGFVKMKQEMLPRQYDAFMCRLIGKFGRTGYYERRRGERLCSPSDIKAVRAVLQDLGLPNLEFDGYVKQYNWCD